MHRAAATNRRASSRMLMMTLDPFRGPRAPAVKTLALAFAVAMTLCALRVDAKPSIAQYDEPKYPAGFTHFDYADPTAPANGVLNFQNYDEAQSYDSLNPFLVRGSAAPDIKHLI